MIHVYHTYLVMSASLAPCCISLIFRHWLFHLRNEEIFYNILRVSTQACFCMTKKKHGWKPTLRWFFLLNGETLHKIQIKKCMTGLKSHKPPCGIVECSQQSLQPAGQICGLIFQISTFPRQCDFSYSATKRHQLLHSIIFGADIHSVQLLMVLVIHVWFMTGYLVLFSNVTMLVLKWVNTDSDKH